MAAGLAIAAAAALGFTFAVGCANGSPRSVAPANDRPASPATKSTTLERDIFATVEGDPFCGLFADRLHGGTIALWREAEGYGGFLATDFFWNFEGKLVDGVVKGRWFDKARPSVGGNIEVRLAPDGVVVQEGGGSIRLSRIKSKADWER